MAASKFAAVDKHGVVTNVIVWDAEKSPTYTHHDGLVELIAGEGVSAGDTFDGKVFTRASAEDGLEVNRAACIKEIDAKFQRLSISVFATPTKVEELRTVALAGVADVRAATTGAEARNAADAALARMEEVS